MGKYHRTELPDELLCRYEAAAKLVTSNILLPQSSDVLYTSRKFIVFDLF